MSYQTILEQRDIAFTHNAAREMPVARRSGNNKYVCMILKPWQQGCLPYRTIPHGFSAVMTSNGRCIGVWSPGFHWAAPWVQVDFLVPWRHMVYKSLVKECPTQDNVMVQIDVSIVFRIERDDKSTIKFVYELGPSRLNELLQAFQEEAIRTMARKKLYNEIYDLMDTAIDEQLSNTKRSMNERLKDYGITIVNITITNVLLPKDIANTMEQETTYESLNRFEQVKQEFELLKLENREAVEKRKQAVIEELAEERTRGDRAKAEAQKELDQIIAQTSKMVAEIKEKQISEVRVISATSQLKVAELNASKSVELSKIASEADATARKIVAEAEVEILNTKARTEKICAENDAKAREFIAEAENIATKLLAPKREYDRKMRQLRVLKSLAANDKVVLSGNSGDNMVAQLIAAKDSSTVLGLNPVQ